MSFRALLIHRVLIAHPNPATTPDATGQLFVDATGQPVGDATVDQASDLTDWSAATEVDARVEEQSARWPDGPGAGAQLVDTKTWFEPGTVIRELDKFRRVDTQQAYQAVFVNMVPGGPGTPGHTFVQARRIPL